MYETKFGLLGHRGKPAKMHISDYIFFIIWLPGEFISSHQTGVNPVCPSHVDDNTEHPTSFTALASHNHRCFFP